MRVQYWVKFSELREPELWVARHFEEFWQRLRERMLQHGGMLRIEWIIEANER